MWKTKRSLFDLYVVNVENFLVKNSVGKPFLENIHLNTLFLKCGKIIHNYNTFS